MITYRLLSESALRPLLEDSFEKLKSRLEVLIKRDSEKIFGSQVEAKVVATFPDRAIVVSNNGKSVEIRFEAVNKSIRLLKCEELTTSTHSALVKTEAMKAADCLLQGNLIEARAGILKLAPFVEAKSSQHDAQLVDSLIAFRKAVRPWHVLYLEKSTKIKREVLDESVKIDNDRISVRFRSLYEGGMPETEIPTYSDLVTDNLSDLIGISSHLGKEVETAVQILRTKGIEDTAVSSLASFGADLAEDLRSISQTATQALRRVNRTECLARLFDSIASDFRDREIASSYVIKMVKRLADAPSA